jgi:hypothetical protein
MILTQAANGDAQLQFKTGQWGVSEAIRMTITNTGKVGIGTASPIAKLDVNGATAGAGQNIHTTGDIVLGSASNIFFDNNYNYASGSYIGPYGSGSNDANTIKFSTAGSERMTITNTGNVGIGTTNPGFKLQVNAGTSPGANISSRGGGYGLLIENTGAVWALVLSSTEAYCDQTTCWNDASDIAIKYNITNIDYGLPEIAKMKPVRFNMKSNNETSIGFIAQDMEKIIPEVVSGPEGQKGISYGSLTPILVSAMQQQQKQIDNQQQQINIQQKEIQKIRALLEK